MHPDPEVTGPPRQVRLGLGTSLGGQARVGKHGCRIGQSKGSITGEVRLSGRIDAGQGIGNQDSLGGQASVPEIGHQNGC